MSPIAAPILLTEGHYRALEASLITATADAMASGRSPVVLVAAGRLQLERAASILALERGGVLAGLRLFPGLHQFAAWMSDVPIAVEEPSQGDRCLFALGALSSLDPGRPFGNLRDSVSTAVSLAAFFERLLERGVDSTAYNISAETLSPGPTPTEESIGHLFRHYEEQRADAYPWTASRAVDRLCGSDIAPGEMVLYGFYDLNPRQRRIVRHLHRSGWHIRFLSPLVASSPWFGSIGKRTMEMLQECGFETGHRSDTSIGMGRFGLFAESMLTGKETGAEPPGLSIVLCSGGMGKARAVLRTVSELQEEQGLDLRSIAVVDGSRSEGSESIVRLAWHEGIPVNSALEVPLVEFPACRLLLTLLSAEEEQYHHTILTSAALSGCLAEGFDPAPSEIEQAVQATGMRYLRGDPLYLDEAGSSRGEREQGFPRLAELLRHLRQFYDRLPQTATPAGFIRLTREGLLPIVVPDSLPPAATSAELFEFEGEVSFERFRRIYEAALSSTRVKLREADRSGFRITTPESIRGALFRAVIVTGLEEGVFPQTVFEDPRLTSSLRQRLQLSALEDRLSEERFLFRQVLEAAGDQLILVHERTDAAGARRQPSMFLDPFLSDDSFKRTDLIVESARQILLEGPRPGQRAAFRALNRELPIERPFFAQAFAAESARLSRTPFDAFDGVTGAGVVPAPPELSASRLEAYGRCPFLYLARYVWRLEERPDLSVTSRPDRLLRGILLHRVIETLLTDHGAGLPSLELVRGAVAEAAEELGLDRALGNVALTEIFIDDEAENIVGFLDSISELEGSFEAGSAELRLQGALGDTPVRGAVDLLLSGTDGCSTILDLKAGKSRSKVEVARRTRKGEMFQLPVYYVLAEQNNLSPSGAGYLYIEKQLPLEKQPIFSRAELSGLIENAAEWARRFSQLMSEGYFPPLARDRSSCRSCSYSFLCRRTPQERLDWRAGEDDRVARLLGDE